MRDYAGRKIERKIMKRGLKKSLLETITKSHLIDE
jgi:hypothetical protein